MTSSTRMESTRREPSLFWMFGSQDAAHLLHVSFARFALLHRQEIANDLVEGRHGPLSLSDRAGILPLPGEGSILRRHLHRVMDADRGEPTDAELHAPAVDTNVLQPVATLARLDADADAVMASPEARLGRRGRFVDGPDYGPFRQFQGE